MWFGLLYLAMISLVSFQVGLAAGIVGTCMALWVQKKQQSLNAALKPARSVSREEVRTVDEKAIQMGLPGIVLMENAALGLARVVVEEIRKRRVKSDAPVIIAAKTGNNGGDGFALARQLMLLDYLVVVAYCGDRSKANRDTDAGINLTVLENMGANIVDALDADQLTALLRKWPNAVLIVDCLYGTGLSTSLRPDGIALIEALNACPIPKVSCDLPSGLDCDSGEPLGAAVKAVRVMLRDLALVSQHRINSLLTQQPTTSRPLDSIQCCFTVAPLVNIADRYFCGAEARVRPTARATVPRSGRCGPYRLSSTMLVARLLVVCPQCRDRK